MIRHDGKHARNQGRTPTTDDTKKRDQLEVTCDATTTENAFRFFCPRSDIWPAN
jgi:hypothetical protein